MTWSVESLQFVVFTPPQDPPDAFQVWLELFKTSPDGYQRNPDPQQRASNASGTHAGYTFQLQSQTGRLDLFLLGQAAQGSPFPVVINDEAAAPVFRELAVNLAIPRTCTRLALVSTLFINNKSLPEANNLFAKLTKQSDIPSGASDLTFGLNIRRQVGTGGYVVNRLVRWTSLVKQLMQVQIGGGAQEIMPVEQPAVVLNMDINTVPRATPFKSTAINDIVNNLFAEQTELRNEGYAALVR